MKKILLVDGYDQIRELLQEQMAGEGYTGFDVTLAAGLEEAEILFCKAPFDSVIIDGLQASMEKMLGWVERLRAKVPELPVVALISTADFGLNSSEKKRYLEKRVSVANKVRALSYENILKLFNSSCTRGLGEEICL